MQKSSLCRALNIFKNARQFASVNNEAMFPTKPYKLHRLDKSPNTEVKLNRSECLNMFKQMSYIRRMETAIANLYKETHVRGFCHLYSGQEAIAAGMRNMMRNTDSIVTGYRCHAWAYVMGISVPEILAELCGKVNGNVHGKGGSMHLYTTNFFGGNGIIGAQVPVGAGVAFGYKYKGQDNVCYTLYGDGAANQGQIYESFNMAKLWNLPVVFVAENNLYAMGTAVQRHSAVPDFYTRGDFVPGLWVDAQDIPSVVEATRYAADMCRKGKGPLVVEMNTYRFQTHSMSDPGTSYRTREEVTEMRRTRDPINLFKDQMVTLNVATEQELKDLDNTIKKEVEEMSEAVLKLKEGPPELVFTDVYANASNLRIRGTSPFAWYHPKYATSGEFLQAQKDN